MFVSVPVAVIVGLLAAAAPAMTRLFADPPPSVAEPVEERVPVTAVLPFSDTAPVPVPNVPVPFWMKLLLAATVTLPFKETAPVPVLKVPVPVWLKLLFAATLRAAVTVVAPFRDTAPVPVAKVPVPVWLKLLFAATLRAALTVVAPFSDTAPVPVLNVPVPVCANVWLAEMVTLPLRDTATRAPLEARLAASLGVAGSLVTSRLTRLECRSKPMRAGDLATLAQFDVFFAGVELVLAELSPAVVERATELRARYNLRTPDALHYATAVESGADPLGVHAP